MKIEIWSDIACPFCYIGKRRLEQALKESDAVENPNIIYKSYQLAPQLKVTEPIALNEYLARIKGISIEQAKEMNAHVSAMASELGLQFNLEQAQLANTFNAHRFLHLAKANNCQIEAKELLMNAYFCEGKNVDDRKTFEEIGARLGLAEETIHTFWTSNLYEEAVRLDMYEAQQYQITGVPLFLFNERIAISGAQALEVFLRALKRASELS